MPDELRLRIADHEDSFTERKPEGASASEFRRTLVAFANSVAEGRSGLLLIGFHDKGGILGCTNPDSVQKTIRKICERDC
jgi:predicted HTH transcriptional regulator